MKILNSLRSPFNAMFLSMLILFASCSGDKIVGDSLAKNAIGDINFNLELFENHKGNLIDLSSYGLDTASSLTRLQENNSILETISNELGTSLAYENSFKSLELTSYEVVKNYALNNSLMDETDASILERFYFNLSVMDLMTAVSALEDDVNGFELNEAKKVTFESLANTVLLIEHESPGIFTDSVQQRGCAGALIALGFAFAALAAACNPAGAAATVGFGCYLAAANYIRASAVVGIECADSDEQNEE